MLVCQVEVRVGQRRAIEVTSGSPFLTVGVNR